MSRRWGKLGMEVLMEIPKEFSTRKKEVVESTVYHYQR